MTDRRAGPRARLRSAARAAPARAARERAPRLRTRRRARRATAPAAPGVGAQQLQRDRRDRLRGVGEGVERARPRDRCPIVEPDLDRDRAGAPRPRPQPLAELPGHPHERLLERLGVGDVVVEGDLARARLGDTHRLHAAGVVKVGARACSSAAKRSPKRCASSSGGALCRAPTVSTPMPARRSAVFGPTPWRMRTGWPAKCSTACSRLIATNAAGLNDAEAVFATRRDGPMPTDSVMPVSSSTTRTISRSSATGSGSSERSR